MSTKHLLAFSLILVLVMPGIIHAFASPTFETGLQVGPSQCNMKGAKKIIDVTENILNENDTGLRGNTWAFDNLTRNIHVWQEQTGTFCAVLIYHGVFSTVAGPSPSGLSTINGTYHGIFKGGERTTIFSGTLNPHVLMSGSMGTFDFKCNTDSKCPSSNAWQGLFFTNLSGLDISWYGFKYSDKTQGTWINSSLNSTGDITG